MERVETLLKKLQDQLAQHASPGQMLLTVQMLQAELLRHDRPWARTHAPLASAFKALGVEVGVVLTSSVFLLLPNITLSVLNF